jgi:hypothetical protein
MVYREQVVRPATGTARTRWGAIGGCRAVSSEPVRVTAVERSLSDGLLEQGFEMWPSCARMINEGKQGTPASERGAVHALPDEMA